MGLYIGKNKSVEDAVTPVLDTYTGAKAGYSLRLLRSAYTGAVIRVRRSSDNTQQDFNATEVIDGTLLAFCGAGDGFVVTIYDQVGSFNLTNSTTTQQPRIVISGALVTSGGNPCIQFDGTDDFLFNASLTTTQPDATFVVYKLDSLAVGQVVIDEHNGTTGFVGRTINFATNEFRAYNGATTDVIYANADTNINVHTLLANGASSIGRLNGVAGTLNNGTNPLNGIRLGKARGTIGSFFGGKFFEYILYDDNQSANFAAIEADLQEYYL